MGSNRYKIRSFFKIVPLFLGIIFLSTSALSQCVISGVDLLSYPGATFPTTAPTTTGTSLVFGTGSVTDQIIMTVPVIPPGNLIPTSDFSVNVRMYMTRISGDNDPIMGITDGNASNFSGIIANDGTTHFNVNGTLSGNTASITYTTVGSCNGSCGTSVGDSYNVDMTFDVTAGATSASFTTTQGATTSTSIVSYPQTYDPSTGITFALIRQSTGETYQVDSVDIVCATAPVINSNSLDAFVCEGTNTLLTVSASGGSGTSYQWQLGGIDVPGATNDTLEFSPSGVADAGIYTCIVSNPFGSDTTAGITFGVYPSPTASIAGPSTICAGDTVTLIGNIAGGTAPYSYFWTPNGGTNQNSTVFPPNGNGIIYTFVGTDGNGCVSNVDSLEMTVNSVPTVAVLADSVICMGESATLVATATGGTSPYMYTWNPGALNTSTITVNPTSTTTYTVSISDSNTCSSTESATVIVNAGPTSAYTFTGTGVDTVTFVSTSTGAISWSWDFGDGSTSTLENPEHIYTSAGSYDACLTTTDANGCTNTVCQTIEVGSAGINSNDPLAHIYSYPNPADQFVNLKIENQTKLIRITDINGRLVYENINPTENLVQIPLVEWSNGMYIIHITNEQNGVNVERLSVSH